MPVLGRATTMKATKTVMAIVIACLVVIGGAFIALLSWSDDTPTAEKQGTVVISIKDAPANWTHLNVTFSEVRIHASDGVDNGSDNATNATGWISLKLNETKTLDLLSLTNASALLASGNVTVGKYTQIRIVVTNVTGVMEDGTNVTFKVPSGELKINHPFNVTEDETSTLTLDFDLAKCVHQTGNGDWIFTPVIGSVVSG